MLILCSKDLRVLVSKKQNKTKNKKLRKSTHLYDWYFIDFFAYFFFTEYFIPMFKQYNN